MFSSSQSTTLTIKGIESHTPETIRDAVSRGAKFVIYSYNFSVVVMSFKRPSNIHFVRPGENAIVKGLPYTLISLLFGWWGIPWGIIYTIQSLCTNLTGGTDVTASVVDSFFPAPSASDGAPAQPPRPIAPARPFNWRPVVIGAAFVLVFGLAVYAGDAWWQGQRLKVAVVSGLPADYDVTVTVDGRSHVVRAQSKPAIIELPEGAFTITARLPGGVKAEESFTLATDFWSRPTSPKIAVINPDRTAVLAEHRVYYYPLSQTAAGKEGESHVHAGAASYLFAKPDYVFEAFPESIRLPRSGNVAKTRIELVDKSAGPEAVAAYLKANVGYGPAADFINALARFQPENEFVLRAATATLNPVDAKKFYQARLAQRPVLVEWHRYYQHFAELFAPEIDLVAQYRGWSAAEPGNGDLLYLYGRVIEPPESRELFRRATNVQSPSVYALNALAFDEVGAGHFERALELVGEAEKRGLKSDAVRRTRRAALLGLHRYDTLLADVRDRRKTQPANLELVAEEIRLALAGGAQPAAATQLKTAYRTLADVKRLPAKETDSTANYLDSVIALGCGQRDAYVKAAAKIPSEGGNFALEITRGNHAAAAKMIAEQPRASSQGWLLAYLAATQAGDAQAAEANFARATAAMLTEGRSQKSIARSLSGEVSLPPARICEFSMYPEEKRVLFTALGLRQPEHKETYFKMARMMNLEPDFPHQFLRSFIGE